MARTTLKGRNALVLGLESAPGRACAQQLSRAGSRVLLAGRKELRVRTIAEQLILKGGHPIEVHLKGKASRLAEILRESRDEVGHLHMVVNAAALAYDGEGEAEEAAKSAVELDQICFDLIRERSTARMVTLWPEAIQPAPEPIRGGGFWHAVLQLGPCQRLDDSSQNGLEPDVLRAASIADTVVCLLQAPMSVLFEGTHLRGQESRAKK